MKKLLLLCSAILLFSCSQEAPQPKNAVVTATIDGVDYTFNTINVREVPYEGYTDVEVTASIDSDPNLRVSFVVEKYVKGTTASWYFAYFLNETAFPKMPGFVVDVEENSENELKGTFSGQVQADVEPHEIVDFENGTFDIIY